MDSQLILTDETLRVACAILPYGRVSRELGAARAPYGGGHLLREDVDDVRHQMTEALAYPGRLVTLEALEAALKQYELAAAKLDRRVGKVSVFVWDVMRDGLAPGPEGIATTRVPLSPPTSG